MEDWNQREQVQQRIETKLSSLGYCIVHQLIKEFYNTDLETLIKILVQSYQRKWSHQYSLLCCVVIKVSGYMTITYETYQNIFRGIISRQETHNKFNFDRKDIQQLNIIAIFSRSIPFQQIKSISNLQPVRKDTKYINKFAPKRVIPETELNFQQVSQIQRLPNLSAKKRTQTWTDNSDHKLNQTKKLMLVSQSSESEDYYFKQVKKQNKTDDKKQSNRQIIQIEVEQLKNCRHQLETVKPLQQFQENKSALDKFIQNKAVLKFKDNAKNTKQITQKGSKKSRPKADFQKESNFMSTWMQKPKSS